MNIYRHTQPGKLMLVVMAIMSVVFIVIGFTISRPVLVGVPVFLLCAWLFHSLTIEIVDGQLRWRFGPGLIRKTVPLHEVASAEAVRTGFIDGWGIHFGRFGWLYNVSGNEAVAITLKTGKRFALGTDEPQTLVHQLRGAS